MVELLAKWLNEEVGLSKVRCSPLSFSILYFLCRFKSLLNYATNLHT